MLCSNCGSDHVRQLSAVFEQEKTLASAGTGIAGDEAGARDRHASAAETRAAPPAQRNVDKSISCIAVFGVVGIAWHILWAVAAVFLTVAIRDAWWNTNTWPQLYAVWEASQLCERCGFIGPANPSLSEDGGP